MTTRWERIVKEQEERKKRTHEQMIKDINDALERNRLAIKELFKGNF